MHVLHQHECIPLRVSATRAVSRECPECTNYVYACSATSTLRVLLAELHDCAIHKQITFGRSRDVQHIACVVQLTDVMRAVQCTYTQYHLYSANMLKRPLEYL